MSSFEILFVDSPISTRATHGLTFRHDPIIYDEVDVIVFNVVCSMFDQAISITRLSTHGMTVDNTN